MGVAPALEHPEQRTVTRESSNQWGQLPTLFPQSIHFIPQSLVKPGLHTRIVPIATVD